jgi:hypothetical protein
MRRFETQIYDFFTLNETIQYDFRRIQSYSSVPRILGFFLYSTVSYSGGNVLIHIKWLSVNAYEVLATSSKDGQLNDQTFSDLVHDFRNGWLSKENYAERLELHRQPLVLKNEILRKLYDYFQDIQRRPEMRCPDLDGKGGSYVPTVVTEILNRDKRIESTFNAIVVYCQWSKSDLLTIAVHMAEFKAVEELIALFQRETMGHNEQQRTNSFFRFA